MDQTELTWRHLQTVRKEVPLVHNITNYVVMNNTANALLALGASPVMAHAREEVTDMVSIAGSLVINIGTLSPHWVEAMELAMIRAGEIGVPVIMDPVGAGATPYRTETVKNLLKDYPPDIIRGNASEIGALYSAETQTKGVDSTKESYSALDAGRFLAEEYSSVVVISGETDFILTEENQSSVFNGSELMSKVTGMGCIATVLIGAFAAVVGDYEKAALSAMRVMGITGEMAAEKSSGPGTLQLHFLDVLHNLNKRDIEQKLKTDIDYA